MSEVYDMCCSIKTHNIHFVLNPDDCWTSFPSDLYDYIRSDGWKELKFMNDACNNISDDINNVPSDKGGIYVFVLHPDVIPDVHRYILYIGRVQYTEHQNLKKRFKEYVSDTRSGITMMRETWGKDLYIRYLPLDNNDLIKRIEKELIQVIIPPFNSEYSGVLNKAMKAAFN